MSFLFLLIYIFLTIIRPQDWVPGIRGVHAIQIVSACTIFFLVFEAAGSRKGRFLARVPQNGLMIGLYFSVLMSHVAHTYFAGLTYSFWDFLIPFILFFLLQNGINTERKFKTALWFMVLLIVTLVPQCVYQAHHGYGWAGQQITYQAYEDIYRVNWIGIFNDPNDLALLFVIALGFLLPFVFGKVKFITRVFNLGLIAALIYGIFLTNSRGGYLALLVTVYFFFVRKSGKLVLGSIVGGIMALALLALGPTRMGEVSTTEASASSRLDLWYGGLQLFKHNPIFGFGYGRFMEDLPQTAHNSYLLAASEIGIMGMFCWVGLIYISFKGLNKILNVYPEVKNYTLGLQSSLVGFSAAAFFLSRTFVILPYILFAFSGALAAITKDKYENVTFRFTRQDARDILGACFLCLLVIYLIVKFRFFG